MEPLVPKRAVRALAVPQHAVGARKPTQILNAADQRASATVLASGSVIEGVSAEAHDYLRRMATGHLYTVETMLPRLRELNEALKQGSVTIPPTIAKRDFYRESAPAFTVDDSHALATLRVLAKEMILGPVPNSDSDLLITVGRRISHVQSLILYLCNNDREDPRYQLAETVQDIEFKGARQLSLAQTISTIGAMATIKVDRPEIAVTNPLMFLSVDDLPFSMEFSTRIVNCINGSNIRYVFELVRRTEDDMMKVKNLGVKSVEEIKEVLETLGLSLGMSIDFEEYDRACRVLESEGMIPGPELLRSLFAKT